MNNDKSIKRPRLYQLKLVEKAMKKSLIVFLKTGSGKTFIATMLIRNLSTAVFDPYSKGGKRSVFVVNNKPLVPQQANVLRKNTHLKIGEYYGDKFDSWDAELWKKELDQVQVLVIIAQIFVDAVTHNFIDLNQINLVIFDECHNATGKHPYSQLLNLIGEKTNLNTRPRLLGLTASIVNQKCNLNGFKSAYKNLEQSFGCKIETACLKSSNEDENDSHDIKKLLSKPAIETIIYKSSFDQRTEINEIIDDALTQTEGFIKELDAAASSRVEKHNQKLTLEFFKDLQRELKNLNEILTELGIYSFSYAFEKVQKDTMDKLDKIRLENQENARKFIQQSFENLKCAISKRVELDQREEYSFERMMALSSEKLNCLVDIFIQNRENHDENQDDHKHFHAIVFAERKLTVEYLSKFFNKLADKPDSAYKYLKSGFVIGSSTYSSKDAANTVDEELEQQKFIIQAFSKHKLNILFATKVIEEGIDIPRCNMVIRFNLPATFGSYYQSKGRARSAESTYYFMVDEENLENFKLDLKNFLEIENHLDKIASNKEANSNEASSSSEDDDEATSSAGYQAEIKKINELIPPYKKGNAELQAITTIGLLERFCTTLLNINACAIYPIYECEEHQADNNQKLFSNEVRLPPNSIFNEPIKSSIFSRKKNAKRDAAMKMCRKLDTLGLFNDNLTFVTKEQFCSKHIEISQPADQNNKNDNKNSYEYSIADELLKNHPAADRDHYLYSIQIKESQFDENNKYQPIIDKNQHLGFLTSKEIRNLPVFNLYSSFSKLNVIFKQVGDQVRLNQHQFDLAKSLHEAIFNKILNLNLDFNFDPALSKYGGFVVILKQNDAPNSKSEIDWAYLNSSRLTYQNLYDLIDKLKNEDDYKGKHLARLNLEPKKNCLYRLKEIDFNQSPLTKVTFKKSRSSSFKEYFKEKYSIETLHDDQPLAELQRISGVQTSFLNKKSLTKKTEKEIEIYKEFYISEHVDLMPLEEKFVTSFQLLPSIFYRLNTILRARKLCNLLENKIISELDLKISKKSGNPFNDEGIEWDKSLKFNKMKDNSMPNSAENQTNNATIDDATEPPPFSIDFLKPVDQIASNLPNTFHVLQSLTMKSANHNFDLERYELLGDCYLKLLVVLNLYCKFPKQREGDLVELKSALVSNDYLYRLAMGKNLQEYIVSDDFDAKERWRAPYLCIESKNKFTTKNKAIADSVESLIGLYLERLGMKGANIILKWLDFKLSKLDEFKLEPIDALNAHDPVINKPDDETLKNKKEELRKKYSELEEQIGYKFKNIFYLYEAFTHPSYTKNVFTASYQRLELVGDSVIDFLITQHLFADPKEYSPGDLTQIRMALVNNKFLAYLAIKHGFFRYLDYDNNDLFKFFNDYIQLNKLCMPWEMEFSEMIEKTDEIYDDDIPKSIADIFESVAGAIYLDSNRSLDAVWRSYYKFFTPYIENFKTNWPRSAKSILHELKPNKIKITTESSDDTNKQFKSKLEVEDISFESIGSSKSNAEKKAFRKACLHFRKIENKNFLII